MNYKILNVRLDVYTQTKLLKKISDLLQSNQTGQQLITLNPEFILEAQKNPLFKNIINNSWACVADGYGLRLATTYNKLANKKSNFFGKLLNGVKVAWWGITRNNQKLNTIPQTITGTDLVPAICKLNQTKNIYLLGGFDKTPKLTATKLKSINPNLNINYSTFETEKIVEKINQSQPQVLFVALNHPKAQIWINENLPKLPTVKLAIGVGGAFDYLSGAVKRAPESWQGFEWAYRLIRQPKRLKRIFNAWIVFSLKVFLASLKKTNIKNKNAK